MKATPNKPESADAAEAPETPAADEAPKAPKGKTRKVRRSPDVSFMVHPYLGIEFRGEIETVPIDDSWVNSQLAAGKLVLC